MGTISVVRALTLLLLVTKAFGLSNNLNKLKNHVINVWDNVLTPSLSIALDAESSKVGLGHRAFSRPLSGLDDESKVGRSLIELAIDEILTNISNIGSSSENASGIQYVEYWTRQEWRHIEAHADVDEHLAKDQDKQDNVIAEGETIPFRYPSKGHVLYLQVGQEVKGPTCVFPNVSKGGDLISKNGKEDVELVTVPAVQGRLLRFDGDLLHAVPRPYDVWFLPFVKGAPEYTPIEDWGRSVILFNVWDEKPPKDVPLDDPMLTHGKNELLGVQSYTNWINTFSLDQQSQSHCFKETCIDDGITFGRPAKIWLLGNERRRGHHMRTVKLQAPEDTRNILGERHKVNRIQLIK